MRVSDDKRLADADRWRRYRCRNGACAWEGLLQVSRRRRMKLQPVDRTPTGLQLVGASLAFVVLAAFGWGLFQLVQGFFFDN